jgi:hypothetical protein
LEPPFTKRRFPSGIHAFFSLRSEQNMNNIGRIEAQEGIMARALIIGLVELGSLAIFSACVAVLAVAVAPGL